MAKRERKPAVRCAIYCRKSSEENLDSDFNSLDAQRECCEAYVKSQVAEGWTCLPEIYSDGGYSGGNTKRPALQRLLSDIDAGRIDVVLVYKYDRLSRSLKDFFTLLERFETKRVSFVSVTQQFNTATSAGRLMLNMLLSFAQFEREIVSERTRDKIAMARKRGKWGGGQPVLGYDIESDSRRLVVNHDEAQRVRQIFELYVQHESMMRVVQELERRGWRNKQWTTRKGTVRGGRPFDKSTLRALLRNRVFIGKVRHHEHVYDGEHKGIVDLKLFERVQKLLSRNGRNGGSATRNKHGALLRDILHCAPCGCAMGHTFTSKRGNVRYRYYTCVTAQKRGWSSCPSKSVPAGEIERLVIEQIRAVGRDPTPVAATLDAARKQADESKRTLTGEQATLTRELKRHQAELQKLAMNPHGDTASVLADLHERIRMAEQRIAVIARELQTLETSVVTEVEVATALADFDELWDQLTPREQARVIELLIERIDYDGAKGTMSITISPTGLRCLAGERTELKEAAA